MANPIKILRVRKTAHQRKNAIRIDKVGDIPPFLRESIIAVSGQSTRVVWVNSVEDIPEFLWEAVFTYSTIHDSIEGEARPIKKLFLDNEEGYKECLMGSAIGYRWSEMTRSGWHCWCWDVNNIDDLFVAQDGLLYQRVNDSDVIRSDEPIKLLLDCVEGRQECPVGSVVGYEKSARTRSGWNCWCIGDVQATLVEENGLFYTRDDILEVELLTEMSPILLAGAEVWRNDDGSWSYKGPWGIQTGFPGQAYWVRCGFNWDGIPKGYILTKSEESYRSFIVCDMDGNDLGYLHELDPA